MDQNSSQLLTRSESEMRAYCEEICAQLLMRVARALECEELSVCGCIRYMTRAMSACMRECGAFRLERGASVLSNNEDDV